MQHPNKDFIAEAIADYEAMKPEEQGQLLVQILEDQPILMGFITNLADEFNDEEHEALVTATVVLINAFVSAGVPVSLIPHQMVEEVIQERLDIYEEKKREVDETIPVEELSDSPKTFADLRNYAFFKSELAQDAYERREQFDISLNTIISMIERSVAAEISEKK